MPVAEKYDVLRLAPGHHLAGGERSMPVTRGLVGLARDLVHHFDDLEAVVWPHSASAIGHRFFESTISAWLEGGPFPALGLTAFNVRGAPMGSLATVIAGGLASSTIFTLVGLPVWYTMVEDLWSVTVRAAVPRWKGRRPTRAGRGVLAGR